MTIHNVQPGPQVMTSNPDLFWGLVASMWIGNVMLVVMNLPLIGAWVQLLKVPYRVLYPALLLFCCVGVYSVQNSVADVLMAAGFGVVGYRSEDHTSALQSLMRISYAVLCYNTKNYCVPYHHNY